MKNAGIEIANGQPVSWTDLPRTAWDEFSAEAVALFLGGARVVTFFAVPAERGDFDLCLVMHLGQARLVVLVTQVGAGFRSLTPQIPQLHWFEREIAEQWGVVPWGHPWLKPIRFHKSLSTGRDAWRREGGEVLPGVTDYYQINGPGIHEVAVGPVHAGIIEPGHFRFQCQGEEVLHLEISLGYQHRGIERRLIGGPDRRTLHYMETLSGDTTVGHAWAYCRAIEALGQTQVGIRSEYLRAVALELERLANHTGDLGALAGDVAYLPTASYCGRLRGDFLNLTALMCGSRFGRGLLHPGGLFFDLDSSLAVTLLERLEIIADGVANAVQLLWQTPSVMERFIGCGVVAPQLGRDLGLVGPAGRACGFLGDVRVDFGIEPYRTLGLQPATLPNGDVFARAYVRWLEIQRSVEFIQKALAALPAEKSSSAVAQLRSGALVVSLVEGWRGEICHTVITDSAGRFAHYKVVDPSFHNWMGLAQALRGQEISDFPLNNKSFNLSYCGHDL